MDVIRRPATALTVLTGLNVLNYLDRYVSSALLPLILTGLALTDAQGGALAGVFILVYSLASPVFGVLGDRGGRLRLGAVGVVIWSAATFASGLAPTFAWLLLARAVVGIGEASYAIVTPSLISDLYPRDRRGRALAIFYAAVPIGTAIGYMLGGFLGSRYGWRSAFFVAGGPGILLAFALLLLPEPARGGLDPVAPQRTPLALGATWRALRARPSYLYNTAGQTVYTFALGGLAVWMPTYFVRERHLTLEHATFVFGSILVVAGLLATLIGGRVGDALHRRSRGAHFSFSGWTLVASLPFSLLATISPRPGIFWPSMFVTLFLLFLNTGPLNAAMANVLPPDLRARGFAAYTVAIHLLGDAISPPLIGRVSDEVGLRLPVIVTSALLAIAGIVFLAGRRALIRDLDAEATV